jgi:hypothetical protein
MKINAIFLLFTAWFCGLCRAEVTIECNCAQMISDDNWSKFSSFPVTFCTGAEANRELGVVSCEPNQGYAIIQFPDRTCACIKMNIGGSFVVTEPLDTNDVSLIFGDFPTVEGWQALDEHRFWVIQARYKDGHWVDPGFE